MAAPTMSQTFFLIFINYSAFGNSSKIPPYHKGDREGYFHESPPPINPKRGDFGKFTW